MSNKEKVDALNKSYQKIVEHSSTILDCVKQTDDLISRLKQIKFSISNNSDDVIDDFKEMHEIHIQSTQYIDNVELYYNQSLNFLDKINSICGKPLSDPVWFQHLNKKYLNRAILYELYRQGRFKVAQLFINELNVKEPKKDKNKFIKLHQILYAIDNFDIEPALNWIELNRKKEFEKDFQNDDNKSNINNNNLSDKKDNNNNNNMGHLLASYSDILIFLLHRDKFLHISAVGNKKEIHQYMRQKLEKLRNKIYLNKSIKEIITFMHYESSSIAYYVDDWKFLYYLKIFPNIKLKDIPVTLQIESFQKFQDIIMKSSGNNYHNDNDVKMDDKTTVDGDDVDDDDGDDGGDEPVNRKRNHTQSMDTDGVIKLNDNGINGSGRRKKRKISSTICVDNINDKYNVSQLCSQMYLNYYQKELLYGSFEFTSLIESVWNLSRKAFINLYINSELDLPAISGLQTCCELSLSIFTKFRDLSDDISNDFDQILSYYKDSENLSNLNHINNQRNVNGSGGNASANNNNNSQNSGSTGSSGSGSGGGVAGSSNSTAPNAFTISIRSDDDNTNQNVNGVHVHNITSALRWEDYDTLTEDDTDSDSDDDNDNDDVKDNSTGGSKKDVKMNIIKQQKFVKGRFKVNDDKMDDNDGDDDDKMDDDGEYATYAYGNYDISSSSSSSEMDIDGYVGYSNRKEFKLEMIKKKIIRRSKNKEYKDRKDKYETSTFLYERIQQFDQPKKNKRSKHKKITHSANRRSRYDARSVHQRRHRYLSQSASPTSVAALSQLIRIHHGVPTSNLNTINNINNTPPSIQSDDDLNDDQFAINRNTNNNNRNNLIINPQQLHIPHLHRPRNTNNNNNNNNNDVYMSQLSHQRRLSQLLHRSNQQHQFSSPPPPSNTVTVPSNINNTPLLQIGNDDQIGLLPLLSASTSTSINNPQQSQSQSQSQPQPVGDDNKNNDDNNPLISSSDIINDLDFTQPDDLSILNENTLRASLFTSRSTSPQITNITIDDNTNRDKDQDKDDDDVAVQALLALKYTKSDDIVLKKEDVSIKDDNSTDGDDDNDDDDDDNDDDDDDNSYIDWENESDSSCDDIIYLNRRDRDIILYNKNKLKISTKFNKYDDFVIPSGYLHHSLFICPIFECYVPDPQTKLGCGHIISYKALTRLHKTQLQRSHINDNRNRKIKIKCPSCQQQGDVQEEVRYIYLGQFPDLTNDQRFNDILDRKDLDHYAKRFLPGTYQIAHE